MENHQRSFSSAANTWTKMFHFQEKNLFEIITETTYCHKHGKNTAQQGMIELLARNYTLTLTKFNNYPGENTIRTTWL